MIQFVSTSCLAQNYCDSIGASSKGLYCAETGLGSNDAVSYNDFVIGKNKGIVFGGDFLNRLGPIVFSDSLSIDRGIFDSWKNVIIGSSSSAPINANFTSYDNSNVMQPLVTSVVIGKLTLDNVNFGILETKNHPGVRDAYIEQFMIGSPNPGGSTQGVLNMSNSSFTIPAKTKLVLATDGAIPEINILKGKNTIKLVQHPIVGDLKFTIYENAELNFSNTIDPLKDSTLILKNGSKLNLTNGGYLVLTSDLYRLPRANFDGAQININKNTSRLDVSNPIINNSSISLNSGQFYAYERHSKEGVIEFTGNNTVIFNTPESKMFTSDTGNFVRGSILINGGTTKFTSGSINNGKGLVTSKIDITSGGALDLTGYTTRTKLQDEIEFINISKGGTYKDHSDFYNNLKTMNLDNANLVSVSEFGSYSVGSGAKDFSFSDTTFDIFNVYSPASIDPKLSRITLNAHKIAFTGNNIVEFGVKPSGSCFMFNGVCVPNTTIYNGRLDTNVGNSLTGLKLTGFNNVTFIPMASDANATVSSYIKGGDGGRGVYTISVANSDSKLISDGSAGVPKPVGYDTAPNIPTLQELHAKNSTIPASLSYVIVNDPVVDGQVDISFVDNGLINHPAIVQTYKPQQINHVVTHPTTGNIITTTINIVPGSGGKTAQQHTNVVVTSPGGNIISNKNFVANLGTPTGTKNTQGAANLLGSNHPSLSHHNVSQSALTIHPEPYASFMTIGLEQSDMVRSMVLNNAMSGDKFLMNGSMPQNTDDISSGYSAGEDASIRNLNQKHIWVDTSFVDGDVNGKNRLGNFGYKLYNMVMGGDVINTENSAVGLFLGLGHHDMHKHKSSIQKFSANSYHVGGYSYSLIGDWNIRGMLGYSLNRNDASRKINLGSVNMNNNAKFNSHILYTGLQARYKPILQTSWFELNPELGVGYSYYHQGAFSESGISSSALKLYKSNAQSIITNIGLNASLKPIGLFQPIGFIRYEHDLYAAKNSNHKIKASLANSPDNIHEFIGQNRGANTIVAGIGLSRIMKNGVLFKGGVTTSKSNNGHELGVGINASIPLP